MITRMFRLIKKRKEVNRFLGNLMALCFQKGLIIKQSEIPGNGEVTLSQGCKPSYFAS